MIRDYIFFLGRMIRDYILFLGRVLILSFSGSRLFYAWMAFLTVLSVIGGRAFCEQVVAGLDVTYFLGLGLGMGSRPPVGVADESR